VLVLPVICGCDLAIFRFDQAPEAKCQHADVQIALKMRPPTSCAHKQYA
jgi:hypothetical protein